MTGVLPQIVNWLNVPANALGRLLLAPLGIMPGWLSSTLVSIASGCLLLLVFKHTSRQAEIRRVRDGIQAHLLALKLFTDSPAVAVRAQAGVFRGAFLLLLHAAVPMLIMLLPVTLLLSQLGLWYQARPLRPGEETTVTAVLRHAGDLTGESIALEPVSGIDVRLGPVRVPSKREVWWKIAAREPGYHAFRIRVGSETFDKSVAIGEGYMRVSPLRPAWNWKEILLYPAEPPLAATDPVESIEVDLPTRRSWTSGTDRWLVYWLVVSFVTALSVRRWLNVSI